MWATTHAALVGFVDNRAVHVRLDLRHRAVPIVNPDLDDRHLPGNDLLDVFPAFGFAHRAVGDAEPIRRCRPGHRGCRNPAADGQEQRRVRNDLRSQLVRQLRIDIPPVEAHAHRRGDAVVRVTLQVIDQRRPREVLFARHAGFLIRVADVVVRIDKRGDDGFARQIDACCACRLKFALAANPGELVVLDDERRIFDRCAPIAGNEPGALEQHRGSPGRGLAGGKPRRHRQNQQRRDDRGENRGVTHDGMFGQADASVNRWPVGVDSPAIRGETA